MPLLLVLHLAACIFMTGLIWLVQIIHYPGFSMIEESQFKNFHSQHSQALTILAGPTMTRELLTGALLLALSSFQTIWCLNFALIAFIWIVTFTISVPIHKRLTEGFCQKSVSTLIKSNWLRTIAWSARSTLLSVLTLTFHL